MSTRDFLLRLDYTDNPEGVVDCNFFCELIQSMSKSVVITYDINSFMMLSFISLNT